jgi:hypothetical protein
MLSLQEYKKTRFNQIFDVYRAEGVSRVLPLEDARQFLQSCSEEDLAWQRSLLTLSSGRQGAYKHKWRMYVLSHSLHLLFTGEPEFMRTFLFIYLEDTRKATCLSTPKPGSVGAR